MAEQNHPAGHNAFDAWNKIDSTVNDVIGKRVFYNDTELGKCLAFVTGVSGRRTPQVRDANFNLIGGGQSLDFLIVFPNNGSMPMTIEAVLSGDRKVGTYSLANDGDLTDAPNTAQPHPAPEVAQVEQPASVPQNSTVTAPLPEAPKFDPADTNQDGTVSNKERKQYDKNH